MRCRRCNEDLAPQELPPVRGRGEQLEIELFGLRGLACQHPGHPREPTAPDFTAELLARIRGGAGLPWPVRKGLLRKRSHCERCGEALSEASPADARRAEVRARIRIDGAPPFTLSVEGPTLRCGSCGRVHLAPGDTAREELCDTILKALVEAGLTV